MKRFAMAIALTFVFATTISAGDIPSGDFVPPPPPPPGAAQVANAPGEIPSVPGEIPSTDFAQQISNELLLIMFGMFVR